jgi:Ca2+-binding EF-hand superfamily protein
MQPQQVFSVFYEAAKGGPLSLALFQRCFQFLLRQQGRNPNSPQAQAVTGQLFQMFDRDGNGVVDISELASGLSVLCGGSRDEKIEATFNLYDTDGDGYISLEEMEQYFASVFKVLFASSVEARNSVAEGPQDLARITAEQCFADADLNNDGRISYEEFKFWYQTPSRPFQLAVNVAPQWSSLAEVRRVSHLENYSVAEVSERFAEFADEEGFISRSDFNSVFRDFILNADDQMAPEERKHVGPLIDRLFRLFDVDGNGVVDFSELASGLSVLCGGSGDSKVASTFQLYDIDGDGFISKEEMVLYLTSVFKVLFGVVPGLAGSSNFSATEMATATMQQCFQEADVNHDGRLSFEEFSRWYKQPGGQSVATVQAAGEQFATLVEVQRITNLLNYSVSTVMEELASVANEDGLLSPAAFRAGFSRFVDPSSMDEEHRRRWPATLKALFKLFDMDGNGVVDFTELSTGVSLLCGGTPLEKARAAFQLHDVNGDGFIYIEDMKTYLASVYRVVYATTPGARQRTGLSAEGLAEVTADACFEDADLDGDGRLSFEEFSQWFSIAEGARTPQPSKLDVNIGLHPSAVEVNTAPFSSLSLEGIQSLTGLGLLAPDAVFEVFARAVDDNGFLSRQAFNISFGRLIQSTGSKSASDALTCKALVDRLFSLLDHNQKGLVDFTDLASAVSVLCGGGIEDKANAVFALFDFNGDGYITQSDLGRLLNATFLVLYSLQENLEDKIGFGPQELAVRTARSCFEQCARNGVLSFDDFFTWYVESTGELSVNAAALPTDAVVNFNEVRRLTGLGSKSAEVVFEEFAQVADGEGLLSESAFNRCFRKIVLEAHSGSLSAEEELRVEAIVGRLFTVFDSDGDGSVDFSELASGLSVLCGGSADDKARSAFALYDYNGDGFISMEEMTRYLTAVFKV